MDISTLHQDYPNFFIGKELTDPPKIFYIAIDAEWYRSGNRNIVLSYQIATSCINRTENIIKYMNHNQRLRLDELITYGLESVVDLSEYGRFEGEPLKVFLIAHNIVAEWSVLADRDEDYIIKHINLVRG